MYHPDYYEAFHIAAKLVSEKELKQRRTSSKPQIFIGEAIRPKLAALFDELAVDRQLTFVPWSVERR